jgi:hypothetical protein
MAARIKLGIRITVIEVVVGWAPVTDHDRFPQDSDAACRDKEAHRNGSTGVVMTHHADTLDPAAKLTSP